MRSRITTLLAACLLGIGFGSFLMASPAFAQETQYCFGGSCLNAWNCGPYVNVYSANVNNNYFAITDTASGDFGLQFWGAGKYQGDCIGDYNDSSSDARAGLWSNCYEANGVAWGVKFTLVHTNCGANEVAFKNVHWG